MMSTNRKYFVFILISLSASVFVAGCKLQNGTVRDVKNNVPSAYTDNSTDTTNTGEINWHNYFDDPYLIALIDTALVNNQELNIVMQEIAIRKNEIRAKKGEYLPQINLAAGSALEKPGEYTRNGAVEQQLNVKEDQRFPDPLGDFNIGAVASWEVDIWKKLRNSKAAAEQRYLSSIEGKNFMVTQLVSEIASSYYELLALDNALSIVQQNIDIQSNALEMVKLQKESTKVSQLAVTRFEAQMLNTINMQYAIKQSITMQENYINFLTGRYPTPIQRSSDTFMDINIQMASTGVPAQLLANRPDIRSAEYDLGAAKLDVKSAKASFYPSLGISAGIGYNAFNPAFLIQPQSLMYNVAGDLLAPLINRNALMANFGNANARQMQAVVKYEQTLLQAYIDVVNQMAMIDNYSNSFNTKFQEVEKLKESVTIATSLFNSARADYTEVLFTQRDALDAKLELVEAKKMLILGKVNIYKALGGGWR
ncbi:MAG: TolC family protein [Flavobacteriales bacterium]